MTQSAHESMSGTVAGAVHSEPETWPEETTVEAPRAFLSRDAILGAVDLPYEDVHVPEWGGYVRLQGLTGAQRARINATTLVAKGQSVEMRVDALANLQVSMVGMALVDKDGRRLFTDPEIKSLGAKNAGVVERLFLRVQELSGVKPEAVLEAQGN